MSDEDPIRVGVFSLHTSKETKAICNAIEGLGHIPEWLRAENTSIRIGSNAVDCHPDVDIIANRLLLSNTAQPCEELGLLATLSRFVPVLNRPGPTMIAMHKLATAASLAAEGVSVPDVYLSLNNDNLNAARADFGEEAVYKTAIGTHGGGTWKVGQDVPVNAKVGNRYAFLQRLIEHESDVHRDARIYVVDGEVVGAMYRYAPEHDWRTNVALGGAVENATSAIPEAAKSLALRSTEIIGLDYAGVDIVEGADGWYVLEVNPTAGFKGLFSATSINPAPYIAKLAIERVGGSVDIERVEKLAQTFDDSTPSCQPSEPQALPTEPPVIGYTEEVLLSGTRGSKTVSAKSDTGATRTSIDTKLAADIGAGPIKAITRIKSGSRKTTKSRPVVDVIVGVGGRQHTVTASVEDRGHMDYPVLLGRDILQHYRVDVGRRVDHDTADSPEE